MLTRRDPWVNLLRNTVAVFAAGVGGADSVSVLPFTLVMLRMVFALPFFMLMAWWAGRGKARLTQRDWLGVVGLGFCGYYLSSFLDFWGLEYISASLERLILYLNPTLVLALSVLLGVARAFQTPATQALPALLVPGDMLARAVARQ